MPKLFWIISVVGLTSSLCCTSPSKKSAAANSLSGPSALVPAEGDRSTHARRYYNDLYAAGGLNQILCHYVCFDDDPGLDTFFIFTESKVIREGMILDGTFSRAPKSLQTTLNKDLLFFSGYDNGVQLSSSDDPYRADDGSWVSSKFMLDKVTAAQMRFSIAWETLRYRRTVEVMTDHFVPTVSRYGRCELVSNAVRQHGK